MNYGIHDQSQLDAIEALIQDNLIASGIMCAILIDTAGNTIASCNNGQTTYDTYAFAALAAGNFATVDSMAKLVGETEFSMHYHKGEHINIHLCKVMEDFLLVNIFDSAISLGLLRLKVCEVTKGINQICQQTEAQAAQAVMG